MFDNNFFSQAYRFSDKLLQVVFDFIAYFSLNLILNIVIGKKLNIN